VSRLAVRKLGAWLLATGFVAVLAVRAGGMLGLSAAIALVVCVSVPQLWRLRQDLLDAPALYVASSVLLFGVMSLSWMGTPFNPPPGVSPADVTKALVMVSAALLCFSIGALTAGPARTRRSRATSGTVRSPGFLVGLFVVGLAATTAGLATGAVGYRADLTRAEGVSAAAEPLILLSRLAPFAVLCAAVVRFNRPSAFSRRSLGTLVAIQIVAGLGAGFKGQAILPVEYLLLAYIGAKGRIPWRALAVTSGALFLIVLPVVNGLRAQLRNGYSTPAAARRAVTDFEAMRPDHALEQSHQYVTPRLRYADQVALIMRDTPRIYPFAGGATYGPSLLLQGVPRAVWRDKPVLDQATQYAHTYWQVPETYRTATPMTQIGDLYRNFGWFGALAGALIIGLLLGAYQRIASRRTTLRAEVLHIFVLVNFVAFTELETDLPVLVGEVAKTVPFALVTALFVFPPDRRAVRTWVAQHRIALAAAAFIAVMSVALAAYDGPLSQAPSRVAPPEDVVSAFESSGQPRPRRIEKPAESAALWNLTGAYEARMGTGQALVLAFDTTRATTQVTGLPRQTRPGLLVEGNLVALYDPSRLSPQAVHRLRSTLESALHCPQTRGCAGGLPGLR
jgi:hypothetical protein